MKKFLKKFLKFFGVFLMMIEQDYQNAQDHANCNTFPRNSFRDIVQVHLTQAILFKLKHW